MINDATCTLYVYSVFVQVQYIQVSKRTILDQRCIYVPTYVLHLLRTCMLHPYIHIWWLEAPKRGSSAGGDDVTT